MSKKYGSGFFYGYDTANQYKGVTYPTPNTTYSFQITEEDIVKIKSLKSYISDESAYYDTMLTWRLEDNPQIENEEELSRLFVAMQFISMLADIDTKLKEKYNLKEYHIGLLRRLYLEFDDDTSSITMGYKRPFGNKNVLGDVRDEMRYVGRAFYDIYDEESKVLIEFVNFLSDFYKGGFDIEWRNFVYSDNFGYKYPFYQIEWETVLPKDFKLHSYLRNWSLDHCEVRDKKIEVILK